MKNTFKILALCAAVSALAACGGGSGDSPDATNLNSTLTISNATVASLNGVYGSTSTGISDVNKIQGVGGNDSCDFSFNNLTKAGETSATTSGNIQYTESATTLANTSININGAGYASGPNGDNTTVDRAGNRVTFNGKQFFVPGGTNTFTVTGFLPMKPNRPSGC